MSSPPAAQAHACLRRLYEDDEAPLEYELVDGLYHLGRAVSCHIVIARGIVSRLHATIERSNLRYILTDAGSANHTFVNGREIVAPHTLTHKDVIGLGGPAPLFEFIDPEPTDVVGGMLSFDQRTKTFLVSRQPVTLTPSQYRLLLHLYEHRGQLCTHESCAQAIWGHDYGPGRDADALHKIVNAVRKRLEEADPNASLIQTRRQLGYQLDR